MGACDIVFPLWYGATIVSANKQKYVHLAHLRRAISNGAFGQCDVTAAGAVIAVSGSNVSFSLDGIVFRAV